MSIAWAALCCSSGCTGVWQLVHYLLQAATPVQPKLQHSAAGSALPAALVWQHNLLHCVAAWAALVWQLCYTMCCNALHSSFA